MKKSYYDPEMTVNLFEKENVVTASGISNVTATELAEQGLRSSDFFGENSITDVLVFSL